MKILSIILIIALAGLFCKKITAGQKGKAAQADTFIFGVDGGSRPGNYTYYKIQQEELYRNQPYAAGQETIVYNDQSLEKEKYLKAKQLKETFPDYFLSHPNQTFGCPNCADQGAVHIEIEQNGILKSWDIDTDINKQPLEVRPYIKTLLQIIGQL